mmetsp:Transcript_19151/g.31133  ORF Transcript_19151/g.31133 Transcript_19151/m.31133 type:complete len:216 (-) Transcript_19151:291-938(-)
MFHFAAAVAESPPPMMPRPPFCVSSATASNRALVPFEKLSNSKTPAGPFQTTVFDDNTVLRNNSMDLGPQSIPSQPSGMPSSLVTILISWSFLKSWPQAQSQGNTISTPLAFAFSISFGASSAPFLSKSDLPISIPKQTFMKVYAMPPHKMSLSALSIKFSITNTLSAILAPPTIAVSGLWTLDSSRTWENAASSLFTSKPATHGMLPCMPTMEE